MEEDDEGGGGEEEDEENDEGIEEKGIHFTQLWVLFSYETKAPLDLIPSHTHIVHT